MVKKHLWHGIGAAALSVALVATAGASASAAPQASAATGKGVASTLTSDVYQAVNPSSEASLLSRYSSEIDSAKAKNGFTDAKGAAFKAAAKPADGLSPVYRLKKGGDFMWVADTPGAGEYENAQSKYGYQSQQIDFYASATPAEGTIPVYRYLKGTKHRTAVTLTDQRALESAGWTSEGVKFYAATVDPADWVRWENIAEPGDTIQTVLDDPALTGKTLKLPAGVFEVSNFQNPSVAINIPAGVKGVDGEGNDTILRIKPNSSTYASTIPKQGTGQTNQLYVVRMNNGAEAGTGAQTLSDLWIQGTEQGHLYNGLMVGKAADGSTVKNLLITGIPGDAGSPPGETFGLNWWRTNQSVTQKIEVDGYRWTGDSYATRVKGEKVGSSPIGYNSADDAKLYDAYTHDSKTGMPTFWQSNRAETWNLQSINNNAGINHEESFDIVHHQPVITGSANRQHISFMSQRGDGKLTVIGATVDGWTGTKVAGPIGKGQKLLVLTPTNYAGPNTNRIVTKPTIVLDDGVTPQPFTWAH